MNICEFCGYQNSQDDVICGGCGSKLPQRNPEPDDGPDPMDVAHAEEEWEANQ